jgi:hypothetical protein
MPTALADELVERFALGVLLGRAMIGVGAAERRGQGSADDPDTGEFGADATDNILHASLDCYPTAISSSSSTVTFQSFYPASPMWATMAGSAGDGNRVDAQAFIDQKPHHNGTGGPFLDRETPSLMPISHAIVSAAVATVPPG